MCMCDRVNERQLASVYVCASQFVLIYVHTCLRAHTCLSLVPCKKKKFTASE